ncbi:hypothetical protein SPRG_07699 [Saprolegnia parasitica CBS 223.65]|uniref:DNA replication complex GINS protein SLD5 n=1 Tax=Saprolegnia parasitica (strain CBS 223.65) TaxID=695850 RepID=A0A067CKA4_SAPPC|nr:hypothetical protein SPRG_07699 [Saprolegnia parasitica CBS 223.65]KDO26986.1 hypothetical protein SPRG_07699 [Saprolegnia parasitica CBS 223.65]|eukprot:XP_012202367.1 hypothetical protein SPRG_07699 [Saprolegnia parasitica CBS 223.65]
MAARLADEIPEESLNEDVDKLREAWVNELNAPEILDFKVELLSDMVEQVQNQQEYVEEIARDQANMTEERAFSNKLYQMEIDRIKYMIASYLRIRLSKIEQHTRHVLASSMDRLSSAEIEYATKYLEMLDGHFHDLVLAKFPVEQRKLDADEMIDAPDLDTFVFCESKEDLGQVQCDDRGAEHIQVRQHNRHALRYRAIQSFVQDGTMTLL